MDKAEFINAWAETAAEIKGYLDSTLKADRSAAFEAVAGKAETLNPWFTRDQVRTALDGITRLLGKDKLEEWLMRYPVRKKQPANVGVIMAGNIPMAGFHDLLCVLASGNRISAKLSSSDSLLIPFIAGLFLERMPSLRDRFTIVEKLNKVDAVIATGSNNTSRYFEYYFGSMPHLFRRNRNSAAVITGDENEYDLMLLGRDIFTYFGLGCRNVSKIYVPEGYRFDDFFTQLVSFGDALLRHNKYMNNFDYYRALFLMNQKPFLTNNFLIVTEDPLLASPVSVLHYEFYKGTGDVEAKLEVLKNELQCVTGKNRAVGLGQAQFPHVDDYADGIDTMEFLMAV
jgi:hypothetical protein